MKPAAADISIRNVNLSYGSHHVLKDINLEINPGEFFALLGPSGCGKTTLLRSIAGFNAPQNGNIVIAGKEMLALPPWLRDVGMVFQSYALWPHMTVRCNVAFGLEERGLPRAEITKRVDAALSLVDLGLLGDRRPYQLSGGQQQRVALARTIAIQPTVLLLDEPLSNLDAGLRVQVRRDILAMQRRLGITTVFVTHDQEEANAICDRIAVMMDGVVQQVGAPMDLYDNPASTFVAKFLGTANILAGTVRPSGRAKVFEVASGVQISIPEGRELSNSATAFFRPQNARLAMKGDISKSDAVRLVGRVSHKEFLGSTVRYGITGDDGELFVDIPHIGGEESFSDNDVIGVEVPVERIKYLCA
jgi:iron(III) transport system ATP-binding protein